MIVIAELSDPSDRERYCVLLRNFGFGIRPGQEHEPSGRVLFCEASWRGSRERFLDSLLWFGRKFGIATEEIRVIGRSNDRDENGGDDVDAIIQSVLARRRKRE